MLQQNSSIKKLYKMKFVYKFGNKLPYLPFTQLVICKFMIVQFFSLFIYGAACKYNLIGLNVILIIFIIMNEYKRVNQM